MYASEKKSLNPRFYSLPSMAGSIALYYSHHNGAYKIMEIQNGANVPLKVFG
jgi:hypothetical protein